MVGRFQQVGLEVEIALGQPRSQRRIQVASEKDADWTMTQAHNDAGVVNIRFSDGRMDAVVKTNDIERRGLSARQRDFHQLRSPALGRK